MKTLSGKENRVETCGNWKTKPGVVGVAMISLTHILTYLNISYHSQRVSPMPCPHNAGGIWKRSFIAPVRPSVHTLRAGSPWSHAREPRANRSGVKESGEEAPRKWAYLDLCNFLISASPERSEIPLVEKRERREHCQSIMFDEERLDPHGAGNLLHFLTIKK